MSEVTDWAQAPPEAPTATNTFMREVGSVVRTQRELKKEVGLVVRTRQREKMKRKIQVELGSGVGCEDMVKRKNQ